MEFRRLCKLFVMSCCASQELLRKLLPHLVCSICKIGIWEIANGICHPFHQKVGKIVTLLYLPGGLFAVLRPTHIEMFRYQWSASNNNVCSAYISTNQWGFFRVAHLLWQNVLFSKVCMRNVLYFTNCISRMHDKLCRYNKNVWEILLWTI